MLLISPSEAALAIGAKCGGSSPTDSDPSLLAILNYITPRMEDSLNVASLPRRENRDIFEMLRKPEHRCQYPVDIYGIQTVIRLTNGFLVPDTYTLVDPLGNEVDMADTDIVDVDREQGLLRLMDWRKGYYSFTYTAGFEPAGDPPEEETPLDADTRVLANIPVWMKAIVIDCLVLWYRTVMLKPTADKDLSYSGMIKELHREIAARVYMRYMRPRNNVIWAEARDVD
jgi:hypothetical protein